MQALRHYSATARASCCCLTPLEHQASRSQTMHQQGTAAAELHSTAQAHVFCQADTSTAAPRAPLRSQKLRAIGCAVVVVVGGGGEADSSIPNGLVPVRDSMPVTLRSPKPQFPRETSGPQNLSFQGKLGSYSIPAGFDSTLAASHSTSIVVWYKRLQIIKTSNAKKQEYTTSDTK